MTLTWTPHVRIQIGGSLGNPASEIWSNSFRYYSTAGAPNEAQLQAAATQLLPVVRSWITGNDAQISSAVRLHYVKAVWVQANGKQRDQNTAIAEDVAGGQGASAFPAIWEQTYVLTFRTALNRGRGHAGRIYPPVVAVGPETPDAAYCSSAAASAMAHGGAVLLTGMKGVLHDTLDGGTGGGSFCVFSPGDSTRGTSPIYHVITAVECDQVADIMHSRTNRIPRKAPAAVGV